MQEFDDPKTFSWAKRSLVGLPILRLEDDAKVEYMMYMCQDHEANLPHNEYLENLFKVCYSKGRSALMAPRTIFGDAFVFMMEPKSDQFDKSQRARYIDMDKGFVDSAIDSCWAKSVLEKLLMYPAKGEWIVTDGG